MTKQLNATNFNKTDRPIKILQFGEGNFLRAFVDWIIQDLNDKNIINSGVVVVQPVPMGRINDLARQDGLYTLCLEGIDKGQRVQSRQIIDVLNDFVNPYDNYEKFLSYARSADLEIIVSNTTEAGIVLDANDTDFWKCPTSFPGKLLSFLYERYIFFKGDMDKGLAIIPCELIDYNGQALKKVLNQLAQIRNMEGDFVEWLNKANHFTDTLVDRIVPGYPRDTVEQIWQETGFVDNNVVKGEVFHLWVLSKDEFIQSKFPADKSGLNVIFADDITPYKQRKVKILNGAHTAMVPVAYLCGVDTVGESLEDKEISTFIRQLIFDEIKPTIALPEDQMQAFAESVLERFQNPFVRHELMSIALNSTTKFKTRLLPSYNHYVAKFGKAPNHILFAFAALVTFYKGVRGEEQIALKDDQQYLDFWAELWQNKDMNVIAQKALGNVSIWEQDLATEQNVQLVAGYLKDIQAKGMRKAMRKIIK